MAIGTTRVARRQEGGVAWGTEWSERIIAGKQRALSCSPAASAAGMKPAPRPPSPVDIPLPSPEASPLPPGRDSHHLIRISSSRPCRFRSPRAGRTSSSCPAFSRAASRASLPSSLPPPSPTLISSKLEMCTDTGGFLSRLDWTKHTGKWPEGLALGEAYPGGQGLWQGPAGMRTNSWVLEGSAVQPFVVEKAGAGAGGG